MGFTKPTGDGRRACTVCYFGLFQKLHDGKSLAVTTSHAQSQSGYVVVNDSRNGQTCDGNKPAGCFLKKDSKWASQNPRATGVGRAPFVISVFFKNFTTASRSQSRRVTHSHSRGM